MLYFKLAPETILFINAQTVTTKTNNQTNVHRSTSQSVRGRYRDCGLPNGDCVRCRESGPRNDCAAQRRHQKIAQKRGLHVRVRVHVCSEHALRENEWSGVRERGRDLKGLSEWKETNGRMKTITSSVSLALAMRIGLRFSRYVCDDNRF